MQNMKKVYVNAYLHTYQVEKLDDFVGMGLFRSRTEAIREIIDDFFRQWKQLQPDRKVGA